MGRVGGSWTLKLEPGCVGGHWSRFIDGHDGLDPGSLSGGGLNREPTAEGPQPLPHADHAETVLLPDLIGVISDTGVRDGETDFSRPSTQLDFGALGAAVLYDIAERFLRHAVQTQRRVIGHRVRHVLLFKYQLNSPPLAELGAQLAERLSESESLETPRMQTVGQLMDIGGELLEPREHLTHFLAQLGPRVGKALCRELELCFAIVAGAAELPLPFWQQLATALPERGCDCKQSMALARRSGRLDPDWRRWWTTEAET